MHVSHHSPDDDDFGTQSPADGEDGHETKAEDHKIYAEDDFTSIKQPHGQPGRDRVVIQYLGKHSKGLQTPRGLEEGGPTWVQDQWQRGS